MMQSGGRHDEQETLTISRFALLESRIEQIAAIPAQ
jgi:hypothetical protein